MNLAEQSLYRNTRKNQENMNWEKYEIIYDWKQQYYAYNQPNYITLNCEIFVILIKAEKIHQISYENWFVDSENNLKQIRILISNENL